MKHRSAGDDAGAYGVSALMCGDVPGREAPCHASPVRVHSHGAEPRAACWPPAFELPPLTEAGGFDPPARWPTGRGFLTDLQMG